MCPDVWARSRGCQHGRIDIDLTRSVPYVDIGNVLGGEGHMEGVLAQLTPTY